MQITHILRRASAARSWRAVVAEAVAVALVSTLGAQMAVPLPWTPVPVTLQVFCVLASGAVLGWRAAALGELAYLAAGAAGAPVFAGLRGGLPVLFGPTGGYLVGFVPAAAIAGVACARGGMARALVGCAAAALAIHACGVAWLHMGMGMTWQSAMAAGSAPFVAVDAAKVVAAAVVARATTTSVQPR